MSASSSRETYRPSGRVDPYRLPITIAVWCLIVFVIAAGLQLLNTSLGHFPVLFAVFPTMAVCLLMWACVHYGKIRNPILACVLGSTAALAGQALHFHADQCLRWSVPWSRVDLLPGYVAFRLETDRWVENQQGKTVLAVQPPAPAVIPQAPVVPAVLLSWNALHLLWESLVSAGLGGAFAWCMANALFSERRNCWMRRERRFLLPHDATALLKALHERTVETWAAHTFADVAGQPRVDATVWFVPSAPLGDIDSDVYLHIGDQGSYLLDPEEAAALVTTFPGVQEIAGPAKQRLSDEARRGADPASARIDPVPVQWAGRAVTTLHRCLASVIDESVSHGVPLAIFFATLVTCLLLVQIIDWFALPPDLHWQIGLVFAGGFLAFVWSRYAFDDEHLGYGAKARARFEIACLRRSLTSRPDALVAVDDPAAVPVVWLPREFWDKSDSTPPGAIDHGLVRVDFLRGLILYEGDRERVLIPAAAILKVETERPSRGSTEQPEAHATVILARLGTGVWEFSFIPMGHIHQNGPAAASLLREIEALLHPEEVHTAEELHV